MIRPGAVATEREQADAMLEMVLRRKAFLRAWTVWAAGATAEEIEAERTNLGAVMLYVLAPTVRVVP